MDIAIRRATEADVTAILALWQDADAPATHTDDAVSVAKLIGHDPEALLIADDAGRVVGSVIAAWDGWRGSVYRIVVATAYRRQGLGRRLLDAAETRMRAAGAVRWQAIVVESDSQATGFWSASGWERQPERLRYVKG